MLVGIVGLLLIVGNLHYEMQIRQFEADLVASTQAVGKSLAGAIGRAWMDGGAEMASLQIAAADEALPEIAIRWVWLGEVKQRFGPRQPEIADLDDQNGGRPITFITFDENRKRLRYTFVPVAIPGEERRGMLELTQSLEALTAFTHKTLLTILAISAVLLLFSGTVTYFLIYRKIRRPLEKLSSKALEIGKGNLTADLEIQGDDELVQLAGIVNDMCTRLFIAQKKIHFENLARLKTLEQLRHTEKLSTVGQIAAGIAHEIGTPLNVVDGRAKMIISEPLEHEEIVNCAKIIKTQAERMTLIIRQLLDFSRKKKIVSKSHENLVTLLKQVFHLLTPLAGKQGVELLLRVAPEAKVRCFVDSQQIQQVFMNIIMNAIQATPDKGVVQVELSNIFLKSMLHTDNQVKEFLRVDIRDEGAGIPVANLMEIFTPFFTTKSVGLGTGLGLSIARELLEEHGGWIEVRNRPVKGAEFTLYFKLEETGV